MNESVTVPVAVAVASADRVSVLPETLATVVPGAMPVPETPMPAATPGKVSPVATVAAVVLMTVLTPVTAKATVWNPTVVDAPGVRMRWGLETTVTSLACTGTPGQI